MIIIISNISIQLNNICNRNCWFCPPHNKYKSNDNKYMDNSTFKNVIDKIHIGIKNNIISENSTISLNRYFEPLIEFNQLIDSVDTIRNNFKNFNIVIQTNGDFISKEKICKLSDICNHIKINFYEKNKFETVSKIMELFENDFIEENLENIISLGENNLINIMRNNCNISFKINKNKTIVKELKNRAGELNIDNIEKRTCDCMIPRFSLYIDYNGSVMTCCDTYSDIPNSYKNIIGNIDTDSIDSLYYNLQKFNIYNSSCCKYCNSETPEEIEEEYSNYCNTDYEYILKYDNLMEKINEGKK